MKNNTVDSCSEGNVYLVSMEREQYLHAAHYQMPMGEKAKAT